LRQRSTKKPNLKDLREWGEKVLVRVEDGNKLGGRVREGRWIGVDEQSKGVRVYWPDKQSVSVERNVYYTPCTLSASRNEGEDDMAVIPQVDAPVQAPRPAETRNLPPPPPLEPEREKRVRKPSQRVRDIMEGRAVSSPTRRSERLLARGVQAPTTVVEQEVDAEIEGEQVATMAEHFDGYALSAETSDSEGLEPRTLKEAKQRADWPLWEQAIKEELNMLKTSGMCVKIRS
jgi:hypothetical protein